MRSRKGKDSRPHAKQYPCQLRKLLMPNGVKLRQGKVRKNVPYIPEPAHMAQFPASQYSQFSSSLRPLSRRTTICTGRPSTETTSTFGPSSSS